MEHLGVELTQDVRPPVTDSTLGIEVTPAAQAAAPAHRLVSIGDSLTHGFQHLAIFNTDNSWPMMVARQLGVQDAFAHPKYDPDGPGGNPFNLEEAARKITGGLILEVIHAHTFMRGVEAYYETGPGSSFPDRNGPTNQNLGIWGWDLRDALERTADTEMAAIAPPKANLIPMVDQPGQRAAVIVLNSARTPAGRPLTPLEAARQLGDEPGGIETLTVWLGANNVLGSVISLHVNLSGPGYDDIKTKSAYNVWTIEDFTAELKLVAAEVRLVPAQHVLWATVPHVTIPPITNGLGGPIDECPRYFKFYARPWETEESFDERQDSHLIGLDAWAIDTIIDGYNRAIEDIVRDARNDGFDWHLVDTCAVLDRLAVRRIDDLKAAPPGITPYPLPPALADLTTRFFAADKNKTVTSGGLIGLDGIHPTTCGYSIVAQEFINVMSAAGVSFPNGTAITFEDIRASDTLVSNPPANIGDILALLGRLNHDFDVLKSMLPHL
jgi:hypothetical protein